MPAINFTGTTYTENFNSLANSGTSSILPTGWEFLETGTSANVNTTYTAGTGSSNAADTYSFGSSGSTERAFGGLRSGTLVPTIGVSFTNNTGSTITSLAVSYRGEQWRLGATGRADRLDFQYSLNATSLSTGTWTDVDSLDFSSPNTSALVGALDGNATTNSTNISTTISGLNIANGATFYLRWQDLDATGADDGLAIDNFSLAATVPSSAGVTITQSDGSTNVTEGGATDTYTLVLNTQPTANVTVTIAPDSQSTTSATTLTFTTANWNTAQIVTVTAVDDAVIEGTHSSIITHTATSSDRNYNDVSIPSLTATITDNDIASVITKISQIQGSGSTAALTGTQTIEGIVTRAFFGSTKLNGFYVQEEDADADGNSATSEGIFVFDPSGKFTGNVGDKVRVTGTAKEFTSTGNTSSLTELDITSGTVLNLGASTLPTVTNVQLPVTNVSDLERYEGMLVNVSATTGNLTVTENFQLGRFGQVLLSATGSSNQPGTDARLDQYTQFNAPSVSGYSAYLADIAKREIYLDDGSGTQNLDPIIFGRGGNPLSASNTLRGGDTVDSITGILDERFEGYRIQTSTGVNFTPTNPRPVTPPAVGGTLKVASFNVLNFFNGNGTGGGFPTARGAENLTELNRQRDKIIQAIVTSGVDVVGLEEIENDGYGSTSAIQDLVNGLNTVAGAGTYSFINPETSLATDEITVGLIYKSGKITPVGAAATLTTSAAFNLVGRQPLAQTFRQNSNSEQFTIVVNHFKSKGSSSGGIGDADAGDGQGLSNGTRTRQAQDLAAWLATKPTGTNDPDYLVVGDLNSYSKEDPLTTLAGAGYNNLLPDSSYSYVFDGQVGSLDHALASGSLAAQVSGAEKWHINADEPTVLDYNTNFKSTGQISSLYNADQFRASDHDPVLVGLNLVSANTTPTNVSLSATSVNENVAANTVVGTFTTTDPDTGNTFTYSLVAGTGATDNAAFAIANNSLKINASPDFETKSSYSVRVRSTDNGGLFVEKVLTIQVNNVKEAPTVVQPIDDQIISTNKPFSFNVSNKFADVDQGDTLTYSATGLPTGSSIVANTGVVSGTISQVGIFAVTVTATDSQGSNVRDTFDLTVANNKATFGNDIIFIDQLSGLKIVNALAGSDRVIGTDGNETIDGGAGNDYLDAKGGNDLIFGGLGNDTILGGLGNDTISGELGDDTISGGLGNDTISGGFGNDRLIAWGGGTNEMDVLNPLIINQGVDTYVLGDTTSVFYASSGNLDYADIVNFKANDQIQLKGVASNYSVGVSAIRSAVGIFSNNGTELIAIVENGLNRNTNLATDTRFVFV